MRGHGSRLRRFAAICALGIAGCGGGGAPGTEGQPSANTPAKQAHHVEFVGFDASPPLIEALKQGKLQGIVVQNPFKMGRLGVTAVVSALEKKPLEPKVPTGETLVTPENLTSPEVEPLLNPPKAENSQNTSFSGAKTKKWRVMVIPKGTSHEFWKTIHAGALKAAEELGNVEIVWQGPQKEDDRTLQIQLVQSSVATGVDGILLAPLDFRALKEPVEQAISKGIKVVIFDSALDSTMPSSFVATDNYNGGVLAAKRLGERLNGQGKIILLRYAVGSASTEDRERGFTETIAKEFPKITYLSDDQYAGPTSDSAQRVAQSLVVRYRGQVDGIFCPNESSTEGMLRALDEAGLLPTKP